MWSISVLMPQKFQRVTVLKTIFSLDAFISLRTGGEILIKIPIVLREP